VTRNSSLIHVQSRVCRLAGRRAPGPKLALSIIQDLQYYSELLHSAIARLKSNLEVLLGLQSLASTGLTWAPGLHGDGWEQCYKTQHILLAIISQFNANLKWADGILDRTKQTSNIVRASTLAPSIRISAF
jgi:hypothetical protein